MIILFLTLDLFNLPSVLIPGFDLCVGQIQLGRQFLSILDAQVFLFFETSFQGLELIIGEGGSGFSLLSSVSVECSLRSWPDSVFGGMMIV